MVRVLRRFGAATFVLVAALAAMVAVTTRSAPVEETLATIDDAPTPEPTPEATVEPPIAVPTTEPVTAPAPKPTAQPTAEAFVPNYVADVDLGAYDANVTTGSAVVVETAPTAEAAPPPSQPSAPAPTSAPTAQPAAPTPVPPTPAPTTPPSAPAPTATTAPAPTAVPSGAPTAEQWAQVRACESGGNYQINTGNGYYGAYQFSATTWNNLASQYYPSLVGVLPSDASPADQDAMAYKLWEVAGRGQWPTCGRVLP